MISFESIKLPKIRNPYHTERNTKKKLDFNHIVNEDIYKKKLNRILLS